MAVQMSIEVVYVKTTLSIINLEIIQVPNIYHSLTTSSLFNFTIEFSVHSLYISTKYSGPAVEMVFKVL